MTARVCLSNIFFETSVEGSKRKDGSVNVYRVAWEAVDGVYRWTCDCNDYVYRKSAVDDGMCKHTTAVADSGIRCAWNEEEDPTLKALEVDGSYKCPRCGGPVTE